LLERKNDNSAPQTRKQNCRPLFVVADLDGEHAAGTEVPDFRFHLVRVSIDLRKCPDDFAGGIEDSG
jgi:hypothetical protein